MLVCVGNRSSKMTFANTRFLAVLMNASSFAKSVHIELANETAPLDRFENSSYTGAVAKFCLVYNDAFPGITPSMINTRVIERSLRYLIKRLPDCTISALIHQLPKFVGKCGKFV